MSTAQQNAALFNQLADIYGQMNMPIPARPPGASGGGKYTAWLQEAIRVGNNALSQYRTNELKSQLATANKSQQLKFTRSVLESTLGQADKGVRGRRSRQQQRMQEQGVRASSQLQAGPYLGPQGGVSSTPYGSSINLA